MSENIGEESIRKMHEWMRLQRGERNTNFYLTSAILYLCGRVEELERKLVERSRAFQPPAPQDVEEYAKTINFTVDGEAFCSFYEARGWMMGKAKMKSWKAAVRTWKQRRMPEQKKAGRLPDNLSNLHDIP
jgi:hypothetical protein